MTPCTIRLGEGGACDRTDAHAHCAECGLSAYNVALCDHHTYGGPDGWAEGNRAMCALIHRRIVPPRLPEEPSAVVTYGEWADVA